MPLVVAVIQTEQKRSKVVCQAMMRGIAAAGDMPVLIKEEFYNGPSHDIAVFYGLHNNLRRAFREYPRRGGKAVYVDLGYWGRHHHGRMSGYHKVSINSRHPTAYFRKAPHSADRFKTFGIPIKDWRPKGEHILLAGMGAKASSVEGYGPEQWEREAIVEIRKHTDRPIIYRPKPSWRSAAPIEGTKFNDGSTPLATVLENCHAVVTHHSNVAVDALLEGIPAFCFEGVAVPMSSQDLSKIETPRFPDDREQWAADIAHTQFSVAEMMRGVAWKHLKAEGLVT